MCSTRITSYNVCYTKLLRRQIDSEDKAELLEVFERYRTGQLPLIVPITLLKHHFRRHPSYNFV